MVVVVASSSRFGGAGALLVLLGFVIGSSVGMLDCQGGNRLDDHICVPQGYNRNFPPQDFNNVTVGFDVTDFVKVDDLAMTFEVRLKLIMSWNDPQLQVETFANNEKTRIIPPSTLSAFLWQPELFLYGLMSFKIDSVLGPMVGVVIHQDKTVEYSSHVRIVMQCPMDFEVYPFDTQECAFRASSPTYDKSRLVLTSYYIPMDEQNLQAFEVNLHDLSESERTASGNFSVAGFKIEMSRHWRPFINKYFIPCFAMVLVSFVSFIIPPGAIPGRTGLLVTLFLVMITLFRSVEGQTPISDKMTAVSFYITCCLGFIFFAKIEFAVVLFLRRTVNVMSASAKIIKEREEAEAADRAPPPKDDDNEMTDEEDDEDVRNAKKAEEAREGAKTANWTVEDPKDAAADGDKKKTWKEKMEDAKADMDLFNYKMDRIAFFVFLVVFILFNIIFFAIR